ncbi:hypothetical protein [Corallococcus macrosporus]|uniref:Uncharacterized protein n=1 Tax=Myxococcus fulvus (strain ATCC BAA-855 / HW-1) TaxID=483219 RepID=F8CQ34_MYXFH|nr:hypothetical protein [Corallococcus macrosporus]AEI64157.1 hypothetical protein LILAB_11230 [Corallococcus macrosporus]
MSPFALRDTPRSPRAALLLLTALLLPLAPARAEPGIRILNSLRAQELTFNALTTNRDALDALVSQPLHSRVFERDARLRHTLEHPPARSVMTYLTECALPPGDAVEWTSRAGDTFVFKGEVGLCPEWAHDKPSPSCLGYVTACLLARNNAFGRRVMVSMRGEDPREPRRFNPSGAAREWSPMFLPCQSGEAGLDAECGWLGESVGTCRRGEKVTVAAGAPHPGTCTGRMGSIHGDRVLRVCEAPEGCAYHDRLADTLGNTCGGIEPSVEFTCPDSGQYSIMSAPFYRAATPGSWVAPVATSGTYPAAPFGAFTFREGAFYGNMFDSRGLTVEVLLNPDTLQPKLVDLRFKGVVHENVHACHSRDWVDGDSHLRSRICANADIGGARIHGCMAYASGPCEPGSYNPLPPRCKVSDGAIVEGDGDFEGCTDARGYGHDEPITVYLRSPCEGISPKSQSVCGLKCDYDKFPFKCEDTCSLQKSPGQCLQTDACLKDPAECPSPKGK